MTDKPNDAQDSSKVEQAPIIIDPRLLNNYYDQDDEINLVELTTNIWTHKVLILVVTLLVTSIGGLFAFVSSPIYQSEVQLLPPSQEGIIELNKLSQNTDITYSTDYVYQLFTQILQSNHAKMTFFKKPEVYELYTKDDTESKAWDSFLEDLMISLPKKSNESQAIKITFKSDSPVRSAQWLDDYIDLTILLSKEQLLGDVKSDIESKKEQIQIQISSVKKLYSSNLEKEIAKLSEALAIAESLNLITPLTTETLYNDKSNLMIDEVRRLYKLGSRALTAEIETLQKRKDNQLFIPGLEELLLQQTNLEAVSVNEKVIFPVQIDLRAAVPDKPVKPKKKLILAISVILGLMIGLMLSLIKITINKTLQKNNHDN